MTECQTQPRTRLAAVRSPLLALLAMLLTLPMLMSCEVAGVAAYAVAGGPPKINVPAEYKGLDGQSVAVLVDADLSILFGHPLAQLEVCQRVTDEIAAHVPGVKVLDAKQVVDFQQRNIYWNTKLPAELARRLGVTRIVLVDLIEYRLHEPGNVHLWKGQVSANVGVIEANSATPNDKAYSTLVSAQYPPDRSADILDSDERTIRLALLDLFARGVVGKFYDHQVEREERATGGLP